MQAPISLEALEDGDPQLRNVIEDCAVVSPAEAVINVTLKEQIALVLRTLTSREEKIVRMRFGLEDGSEHTLEEVASRSPSTPERVRQIEAKALRTLRHPSRSRKPDSFLADNEFLASTLDDIDRSVNSFSWRFATSRDALQHEREGEYRVPFVIRWPGAIKLGSVVNDIAAHEDWVPRSWRLPPYRM